MSFATTQFYHFKISAQTLKKKKSILRKNKKQSQQCTCDCVVVSKLQCGHAAVAVSCFKPRLAGEGRSHAVIPGTAIIDGNNNNNRKKKKKNKNCRRYINAESEDWTEQQDMSGSGPQLVQTACA